MADFLTNLVGRATGLSPKLRPVVPPLFADDAVAREITPAPEPEGGRSLLPADAAPGRPSASQAADDAGRANASAGPDGSRPRSARRVESGTAEAGDVADLQDERRQPATIRSRRATPPLEAEASQPANATPERTADLELRPGESSRHIGATERGRPLPTQTAAQADDEQLLMPASRRQSSPWPRAAEDRTEVTPEERADLSVGGGGVSASRGRASVRNESSDPKKLNSRAQRDGPPFDPATQDTGAGRGWAPLRDEPPEAGPTIEVTIGRVEVRAVRPPEAREPASKPAASKPRLSLEDYLAGQRGGRP